MKDPKLLTHTYTVGQLIADLRASDPTGKSSVSLAGCLRISRVKRRGPMHVDIEAIEVTLRDPITGQVTVVVPD